MDEKSKELLLSLHDDETMKYQFANACKESAFRFKPEEKWYTSGLMFLVVIAIACILAIMVTQMNIGAQFAEPAKGLAAAMNNLGGQIGGLQKAIAPAASADRKSVV